MQRSLLTLSLCLVLSGLAHAEEGGVVASFTAGMRYYEAQDYQAATKAFKAATTVVPTNDEYAHWLGKAYGRQAEHAGWFKAIKLAKLTRAALERAVALNPQNWDAVRDLAQYYTDAPSFLGGDHLKAEALRARLKTAPVRETQN
jgi:tetratricopeptide (TPR) repeat protein